MYPKRKSDLNAYAEPFVPQFAPQYKFNDDLMFDELELQFVNNNDFIFNNNDDTEHIERAWNNARKRKLAQDMMNLITKRFNVNK